MLIGTYEKNGVPWAETSTPWDFTHELLPPDLERIAPSLEVGFRHFPALERAGIKRIVNGPFTFAPDGNPVVGPIRGLRNYWVAVGVMAGFSQGGGVGLALANWMVERRSRLRRLGDGRRALRRLGDARVHERQGARELFAALPHPLPQRGAAGGAAAADDAGLRSAEGERRGVRRGVRPRARAVVRARRRRAARGRHLPPLERAPLRRRRMPRGAQRRRPARDLDVLPLRGERRRRRRVARSRARRSPAAGGASRALADAERRRPADRRLHRRQRRSAGTSCSAPASPSNITCAGSKRICRRPASRCARCAPRCSVLPSPGRSRASCSRASAATTSATPRSRSCRFARSRWRCCRRYVGRISFTGELGYEIWVPADCQLRLYEALRRSGRRSRAHAFRRAGAAIRCGWRRASAPGPANSGRSTRPTEAGLDRFVDLAKPGLIGGAAAAARARRRAGAPARHLRRRRERCRRDRRRAGLARRQGRRLGHLRRLRPLRRQVDRAGLRSGRAGRRDRRVRDRDPRRAARGGARVAAALRSGR